MVINMRLVLAVIPLILIVSMIGMMGSQFVSAQYTSNITPEQLLEDTKKRIDDTKRLEKKYGSLDLIFTDQFGLGTNDYITSIATDSRDRIIVTGLVDTYNENDTIIRDMFLRVYDSNFMLNFTEQFGTGHNCTFITSVAVDSNDRIIVGGYTCDSFHAENLGRWDAFFRVYSSDGVLEHGEQFGTEYYDYINSVTVDSNDRIIVGGTTKGLSQIENHDTNNDAFFRIYSSDVTLEHVEQFGEMDSENIQSVTTDSNDRIIVAGNIGSDSDYVHFHGDDRVFFRIYSSDGVLEHGEQFGTEYFDHITSGAVDSNDRIIVAGTIPPRDSRMFSSNDMFFNVYSSEGILEHNEQFGTSSQDYVKSVAVDSNDRIIVAGNTGGSLHTEYDDHNSGFFRIYDSDLILKHAKQYEITSMWGISSVTVDSNDRIIVGGSTSDRNNQNHTDALLRVYDYKNKSSPILSNIETQSEIPTFELIIPFTVTVVIVVFALYTALRRNYSK